MNRRVHDKPPLRSTIRTTGVLTEIHVSRIGCKASRDHNPLDSKRSGPGTSAPGQCRFSPRPDLGLSDLFSRERSIRAPATTELRSRPLSQCCPVVIKPEPDVSLRALFLAVLLLKILADLSRQIGNAGDDDNPDVTSNKSRISGIARICPQERWNIFFLHNDRGPFVSYATVDTRLRRRILQTHLRVIVLLTPRGDLGSTTLG